MARKIIVVGNWKMNPSTIREAKALFEATKKTAERCSKVNLIIAPPAIYLHALASNYRGTKISFSAQNAHFEASGARTGETSIAQARDAGANFVLVGHSERRAMGETNEETGRKVSAVLAQKMTPILCVGETKRESSGEYLDIVGEQDRKSVV